MGRIILIIVFIAFLSLLQGGELMSLHLTSQVFKDSGAIPSKYTCDGDNISPPLQWKGIPEATKCLVLIVDDPDAPSKTWVHWVVYNIPPTITEVIEGSAPSGSVQGINDYSRIGYAGPCPPSGTHRYFFKLYALDQLLTLSEGATKTQVESAMKPHILEEVHLIATYKRH